MITVVRKSKPSIDKAPRSLQKKIFVQRMFASKTEKYMRLSFSLEKKIIFRKID